MAGTGGHSGGFRAWAAALSIAAATFFAACGSGDSGDSGAGNPDSELSVAKASAPLNGASPALTSLRAEANQVLGGGLGAFEARLGALEGTPVVVNKWASWCGPCREEFPYFQAQALKRGDEIAFIGLLSNDGEQTGSEFLSQLPLPYPSYLDSDQEIAFEIDAGREFPSTLFIDAAGEVVHTKLGPYIDEAALAADIDRYLG